MDFSKVQTLNANLKYTNIKGKNYITVNQRVLAFRELYPNGRITTEIVKLAPGADGAGNTVIVKAFIYDGEALIATGHAFENPGKNTNINKFSALENCETSAVGRALGFLGIGATDSIASLEEIQGTGDEITQDTPTAPAAGPAKIAPDNLAKLATQETQPTPAATQATPAAGPAKIAPDNLAKLAKLYQGASLQKLLDHFQLARLEDMDDDTARALLAKVAQAQKAKKGAKS